MLIDFKEIPPANSSDGQQDKFEVFARDFLSALGYQIIDHPGRGADGGKDILIEEPLSGIRKSGTRKWVVSAKHFAHTGRSVKPNDETNISDRIEKFSADGFMGFYSTIPSSGLSGTFNGLRDRKLIDHFDYGQIEQELVSNIALESVFRTNFPKSYNKFVNSGGYSARSKDFQGTITGGDAFPIIFYSIGSEVLPNIKNVGRYTLYDLEIHSHIIPNPSNSNRSSLNIKTFPFLHPGSTRVGQAFARDRLKNLPLNSIIACRNGIFHQTTHFSTFVLPNSDKEPMFSQSKAEIFFEDHISGNKKPIYIEHSQIKDGDTGELWIPTDAPYKEG